MSDWWSWSGGRRKGSGIFIFLSFFIIQCTCQSYIGSCNFNSMCSCKVDEIRSDVICLKVPFYKLPETFPEKLTHIDILSSGLEVLENDAFGQTQAESVRLMNNEITTIENKAFSSMEGSLRSLDMSFNKLTNFPYKALHNINHLDWLNLHSNEIGILNKDDITAREWSRIKDTLQTLYLGENNIHDVSTNSLLQYHHLTWLNLDNNEIVSISCDNFPSTLKTLSVCHNYIRIFPTDIMENLLEISRLYLRGNYIRQFPPPSHSFKNKKRLDEIDIGENLIRTIEKVVVSNVTIFVRDLRLDFNNIRTLPSHAFKSVIVSRLYLSRNGMEKLDEKSLAQLSNSLEYLDLEHNRLHEFPTALNVLKRLKYLYISGNKISNISENALKNFCINTKAISLSENQFQKIPKDALSKCTKLSHLNIGYNYIREINEEDFEIWSEELDTLVLRNNRISEINENVFKNMKKLRELSLSFNKIVTIKELSFYSVRNTLESLEISFGLFQEDFEGLFLNSLLSLLWLTLDNNNINLISPTAFKYLENLQYLNLDGNHISRLPSDLIENNYNLRDFRFSNNRLIQINSNTFQNLREIQSISIYKNFIKIIEKNSFNNLPNLIKLILSDNQISEIEIEAFNRIPNLMKLDLQFNNLKIFNLTFFENFTNNLSLNLSHNLIENLILKNNIKKIEICISNLDVSFNKLKFANSLQSLSICLKILDLSFNEFVEIDANILDKLSLLETLTINHNNIYKLHRKCFINLFNLQLLDLSYNSIDYLNSDLFLYTRKLRIIDLSHNRLSNLPKSLFSKTILESLKLSNNNLKVMPTSSLIDISSTLRKLDLSYNLIEYLDSTMFLDIPLITSLNLSRNKLTILPDNVFTSIGNLVRLDISNNPLRANFKELFHYVQKVRYLNLAQTSLKVIPHLPLPKLVSLRLSNNAIDVIEPSHLENLLQLRTLHIDGNKFTTLPTHAWTHLMFLKQLNISSNPIKTLTKENFVGLQRLHTLTMQNLPELEKIDNEIFSQNKMLTRIKIDTFENVRKVQLAHIGSLLSRVISLRYISVRILQEKLEDQLHGILHPKLKEVEISGEKLRIIRPNALKGIEKAYELVVRIHGTQVEDIPIGLLEGIQEVAHVSLDFSNNRLTSLSPAALYYNVTSWENIGTKIIDGGLTLKGNPWTCDCGLVWIGHWMRRWLRESLEIHTLIIEEAQQLERTTREATCFDPKTNNHIPIVDLHPEDLSCQASALSGDGSSQLLGTGFLGCVLKSTLMMIISTYIWLYL